MDKYEVLGTIGEGTYGTVIKVKHKETGMILAIKKFKESDEDEDIKPENILISDRGVLKLCDFGFARSLAGHGSRYTEYVSTRWYRAPELLVGDAQYGKAVDVWSIGCILAEMITGLPLFPGESDIDTLHHIMKICGERLPRKAQVAFSSNPQYEGVNLPRIDLYTIDERLSMLPPDAFDFLKLCLAYEPETRPNCEQLLAHVFFDDMRDQIEQYLADVVAFETQERSKLFRKRDATPNKMTFKSVLLDPEQMIPRQLRISQQDQEEKSRASPLVGHHSFLPELKVQRNDEWPIHLRKKKSDLKIPHISNLLKISTECKPRVIELSRDVNQLGGENFYDNYSFKNHIKLRNAASKSTLTKPRTPSTDAQLRKHGPQVVGSKYHVTSYRIK